MSKKRTAGGEQPPVPEFKRRGRIVISLLVVLVVIGLAPLASVAWKLIEVNREALTTSQQEYQLLLASSIATELQIRTEGLREQVERVARTLAAAVQQDGSVRHVDVRQVLADVAREPILFLRYSHADSRGGTSISAGELPAEAEPGFRENVQAAVAELALSRGDNPASALTSGPLVVGKNQTLLVVSAPVLSGGHLRGVLSALVDLDSVWASVVDLHRTGHVIWALDESGEVFASTDPVLYPSGADASASPLVGRFLSGEGRARETMPYEERGEKLLGSYASSGQGWGVFVSAQERQVYLPVQAMVESTLAWSAIALVLAVVAALIFARTLSNPINRLAEASHAFARGEFNARVQVRHRNELGELAFTFNRMADEIEHRIRQLKRAAEENNELFLGTIRSLAQAIDAKDPYTRGHSVRVNRYSVILARELGLGDAEVRDIHVASLLHDVGKIGINDAVLNKPGKLTPEEFEMMKAHPALGATIMGQIPQMKQIIPGLRWHHERWQGGGYPDGLAGEDIPLMARIIAVADTFDAVTTTRPYQKTMTVPEALEVLNRLKGVALDERVVEAFFRAIQAGQIKLDPPQSGVRQVQEAVTA